MTGAADAPFAVVPPDWEAEPQPEPVPQAAEAEPVTQTAPKGTLSAAEAAELLALESRARKGMLKEDSPHFQRYLALVQKREDGTERPAAEPVQVRFATDEAAAEYYGFKWRAWMGLKALGKEMGDPLPVDHPEQMPGWFDRARSCGRRKHRTPDSVLARAREELDKSTADAPPAEDDVKPVMEPLVLGDEATTEGILEQYRRLSKALSGTLEKQVAGGLTAEARGTLSAMNDVNEKIRQWSQSLKKIREGESYIHREAVSAGAAVFLAGLWRLLTRELTAAFPPADEPRVRERLAALERRLPQLLPAEFKSGVIA